MVTLFFPFTTKEIDILDFNKFVEIYDVHKSQILEKRREYENKCNVDQIIEYCKQMCDSDETCQVVENDAEIDEPQVEYSNTVNSYDKSEDYYHRSIPAVVKKRTNVLDHTTYCSKLRTMNLRQRNIVLEVIHRVTTPGTKPSQIFLTGTAGSGKTYTLNMIQETYNRYTRETSPVFDSVVACATTGKAAALMDDAITVHSAFSISTSCRTDQMKSDKLFAYRTMYKNVKTIIIDEASMFRAEFLQVLSIRL